MAAGWTVMDWHWTTRVYERVPVHWFVSVALTAIGKEPTCIGLPDRRAVAPLNTSPGGSVGVTLQAIAPIPPVWVNACEYASPKVPTGIVAGLTVMVPQSTTS